MFVFDTIIIDTFDCNDLDFLTFGFLLTKLCLKCQTMVKHLAHVAVSGVAAPVREAATETPEWRPGSQWWSHHRPANTDTGPIHTIN